MYVLHVHVVRLPMLPFLTEFDRGLKHSMCGVVVYVRLFASQGNDKNMTDIQKLGLTKLN